MKPHSLTLALVALAASLSAQDLGDDHGRVRFVEMGVTLQRSSDTGAEEAAANAPFFPGDRVWTDGVGRAEFQFPDGSLLRLDSRSKLDYVTHDQGGRDEVIVLRLWSGSLILHVRDSRRSPRFDVEAPGGLVTIDERGVYRVDAEPTETRLSVYDGEAVLDAAHRRLEVEDGETVFVRRGEWPDEPRGFDRDRLDDFAYWDRERSELDESNGGGRSAHYLPPEVAPYAQDFDEYGRWHYETEVGYVWAPTVQTGWRPYWNGRWCWTVYGWTWVPNEPWGFAPSHFGRWGFSAGLGWYWIPGGAWSPAWVSWAVGGDHVGWCPLGYRDRPVVGFDRAVPRSIGESGRGSAWTFARRGDLAARDLARRRVEATAVELSTMRVAETARARPTRDLRSMETSVVTRRSVNERPGPRDTVPEMRTDPNITIPWPGAARRDRDAERRSRYQEAESAERIRHGIEQGERSEPRARSRTDEAQPGREAPAARRIPPPIEAGPRGEGRGSQATEPAARGTPSPSERARPADEPRSRRREPDRGVMDQFFRPLNEPRSSSPRTESARPRSEQPRPRPEGRSVRPPSSGDSSRGASRPRDGESRAQSPAPRRAEPSRRPEPPRSGNAERRKPPRDH
jgi:hypothetical protein